MKRTLVPTLLTAVSTACLAQVAVPNGITLYGIVDVGVQSVSGYAGGSNTSIVSGIMDGSRIGLRGSEDLGGGYRALFTLENRTEVNDGSVSNRPKSGSQVPDRFSSAVLLGLCAPTPAPCPFQPVVDRVAPLLGSQIGVNLPTASSAARFWDRQAYVGLVTPFGAVLAGRQYTPGYEISATFDVMQTQSSLAAGQVAAFPGATQIRVSDSVQYRIQMAGFSASAMYGFGNVSGDTSANNFVGAMGTYKSDLFSAGVAYNAFNNRLGQDSLESVLVGASLNLFGGTFSGLYSTFKDDNPDLVIGLSSLLMAQGVPQFVAAAVEGAYTNALRQDGDLFNIGYRMTTGPNTFYVAYSRHNDKTSFDADTSSYGAAYTYALSKRTDLNFVYTHFDNSGLGQAAPGQAGFLGGVTKYAGKDSDSFAFGVRHRF
jgi:predicted porin